MKLADTAALFATALLTACGSGGNNLPSASTVNTSNQASTETGPRVPSGTPFGNGVILVSNMDAANADFKNVRSPNSSFNLLNIDGQYIPLVTSKYDQKDFIKFNGGGEDRIVSGNKYSQVRFGIYQ